MTHETSATTAVLLLLGLFIGAWWSDAKNQCFWAERAGAEAQAIIDIRRSPHTDD